jgi:hypothetical protein
MSGGVRATEADEWRVSRAHSSPHPTPKGGEGFDARQLQDIVTPLQIGA